MANKKAEILTMDGQVVSPITLATNVLLDDGRTAQDLLDSRDESMFSPTITTSSSISKVGQGDNVDFSENIIDGAYKSCVLKGKTLVNHNAEGNNRNEYACMPSLEGSNLTVNGTVESKVKSAILSGQTLVNSFMCKTLDDFRTHGNVTISDGVYTLTGDNTWNTRMYPKTQALNVKPSTTYTLILYVEENNTINTGTQLMEIGEVSSQGVSMFNSTHRPTSLSIGTNKFLLTTKADFSASNFGFIFRFYSSVSGALKFKMSLVEGDYTNIDIPYFEGMQSVKLPVLTTVGKNLCDVNRYTLSCGSGVALNGYKGTVIAKNIKVKPNTKYIFSYGKTVNIPSNTRLKVMTLTDVVNEDIHVNVYSHKNRIKEHSLLNGEMFTTESHAKYIAITTGNFTTTGDILIEDIQIEQGTQATSYEPFKSNILSCNEEVTLRGIGEVKDELDCLTGELTQCVGEVILNGQEEWRLCSSSYQPTDINYISYDLDVNNIKTSAPILCDTIKVRDWTISSTEINSRSIAVHSTTKILRLCIEKTIAPNVETLKTYLSTNMAKVQYQLATESVKTVDLSDNHVYSYKDTTHYTCSSEDGSLIPTLAIEEGVKYKAIIKPSTKYSIVFNRTEVASGLTVDLGGATTSVTSSTLGKNIVQITTPSTLSHNYVIFKGLGNVIKDVQVIEGDVVGDEPYFEGMCDVEMPVVKNVGKNLFDGGIGNHYWNAPFTNGVQDIGMQRADNCASTSRIRVRKGETYHLSGVNLIRNVVTFFKTKDSQEKPFHGLSANSFTSPYDGYIEWYISNDNINNPVKNVQIEAGSTTTPYENHKTNILHTSEEIVLREVDGVQDTYNPLTGEYVQRIGEIVLDGSEGWGGSGLENQEETLIFQYNVSSNQNIPNPKPSSLPICDKFASNRRTEDDAEGILRFNGTNGHGFYIRIQKSRLSTPDYIGFKQWLSQNPITVQYQLATESIKTVDLKQHPFAYKDGHVVLTSSREEISLTPTIEYSLIANRLGQIQSNQKLVEKQQAQIDELESMVITNLVNTQYQQALNEIKLGVK